MFIAVQVHVFYKKSGSRPSSKNVLIFGHIWGHSFSTYARRGGGGVKQMRTNAYKGGGGVDT